MAAKTTRKTAKKAARKTAAKPQKPQAAIRRFDIFAEYNRLEAMEKKDMKADQAKGYGLWLAKVVASRRNRPKDDGDGKGEKREYKPSKWRSLDDKPQTDKLFDKEIVERMGRGFYRYVFAPAIKDAHKRGDSYESLRDSLRRGWKPDAEG